MRDILNDPGQNPHLSDADPVRRAQLQMRQSLPKRFYEKAQWVEDEGGFGVRLDERPVRTPSRNLLVLPNEASARLIADEFAAQGDHIDPMTMPVTRLANSAIDGVAPNPRAVLDDIVNYSGTDLLCYRAEGPQGLVDRQAEAWDPPLDWAHRTLGARFVLAAGVMHVDQPMSATEAVAAHLGRKADPFRLAALHVMTSLMGSALLALAVGEGALTPQQAWQAAHVDEDWNIRQWGEDAEAAQRRAQRERDMMGAAALIAALDA